MGGSRSESRQNIPVVIVRAPHQRDKVDRLIQHCHRLNPNTKINILDPPIETENVRDRQNASFRYALNVYIHTPFLWLEPDAIPLKPYWHSWIQDEYYYYDKPFMLPEIFEKGDIGSGIGVYPAGAALKIPQEFTVHSWDAWVYRNLTEQIHFTRIIQHSYGIYEGLYLQDRHNFPRDQDYIRPEAVIFHSDPTQSLI